MMDSVCRVWVKESLSRGGRKQRHGSAREAVVPWDLSPPEPCFPSRSRFQIKIVSGSFQMLLFTCLVFVNDSDSSVANMGSVEVGNLLQRQ